MPGIRCRACFLKASRRIALVIFYGAHFPRYRADPKCQHRDTRSVPLPSPLRAQPREPSRGCKSERVSRQSALVFVIRGEEFDSVFAESVLVHFTAPGHIDDVLRDFFAHGISVGRFGELTAGLSNLSKHRQMPRKRF
jgi:hypothetical protein